MTLMVRPSKGEAAGPNEGSSDARDSYLCLEVEWTQDEDAARWPHAIPKSALRLSGAHERSEPIRDVLDLLPKRRELRSVGAVEVFEVRHEARAFVDHVVDRLRFPARHAEWPLDLLLRLRRQLIPAIVPLPEQVVLRHLLQEGIHGSRRWPPPALRHRLDLVHNLRAILRRARQDRNDPAAEASLPMHHPAKRGEHESGHSYRITDIYPFRRESVFRYRKSDIRKYRPRLRRLGDKPWPACKARRITIGIVG